MKFGLFSLVLSFKGKNSSLVSIFKSCHVKYDFALSVISSYYLEEEKMNISLWLYFKIIHNELIVTEVSDKAVVLFFESSPR